MSAAAAMMIALDRNQTVILMMDNASNVDTIATARMKTKSVKMEGALKVCYSL